MSGSLSEETHKIGEAIRATADSVRDAGSKASESVTQASADMCRTTTAARDSLSRCVESQPLASVAVAAALGLVTGLLMFRR